jgi:hypothetical protein
VSGKCLHVPHIIMSISIICLAFTTLHQPPPCPIHNLFTCNTTHLPESILHNFWKHPTSDFTPSIIDGFCIHSIFCIDQPDAKLITGSCSGPIEDYGKFIFRGLIVIHGIIANFASGSIFRVDWPDVKLTTGSCGGISMECYGE